MSVCEVCWQNCALAAPTIQCISSGSCRLEAGNLIADMHDDGLVCWKAKCKLVVPKSILFQWNVPFTHFFPFGFEEHSRHNAFLNVSVFRCRLLLEERCHPGVSGFLPSNNWVKMCSILQWLKEGICEGTSCAKNWHALAVWKTAHARRQFDKFSAEPKMFHLKQC